MSSTSTDGTCTENTSTDSTFINSSVSDGTCTENTSENTSTDSTFINSSLSDGTCTENTSTDSTFISSLSSASTENDNTDEEDSLSVEFVAEMKKLKLPSSKWVIQNDTTHIGICKLTSQMSSFAVSICITVNNNFSWNVSVNEVKTHPQNCEVLKRYPTIIDMHTLQLLIANVDKCIVCPGNPDQTVTLLKLLKQRKRKESSKLKMV